MEGMEGEVYIDNADDNTEMEISEEEVPEEWRQLADSLFDKLGPEDTFDWSYDEVDIVTLRECLDIQVEGKKREATGLVECSWCDAVFLTEEMLARHLLLHHLQWNTNCAVCGDQLNNSVMRHECELECRLCERTLPSRRKLVKHYYRHHQTLYCGLCDQTFSTLSEYRDHIRRENRMLSSVCILCRAPIDNSVTSLKEHLMRFHFGPIVISKPTVFEDKTTNHSEVELITHISMKYKPNKTETYQFDNYSCPHCHRKFSAKSGLKIHVGIAHKGGKIIFCSRCPSAFQDVAECKAHFKEEHSLGGKRSAKRKVPAGDGQHKSLVPTNLPVEGVEANIVTGLNNNNNNNNNGTANPEKKKARRPPPALLKIQDVKEKDDGVEREKSKSKKVILSSKESSQGVGASLVPPAPSQPLVVSPMMLPQQPLARSSLSPVTSSTAPRPILPAVTPAPTQVYVPAMTSVGTTILLKLEEAQKHLNNGVVTFLPSSSQAPPPPPPPPPAVDPSKPDIMREKVALNLPVVMTKRTNKKLAQDNPFYRVVLGEGGLAGACRTCDAVLSFRDPSLLVSHYQREHGQSLNIHSFPLYYEINYKVNKDGSKATVKYFLCHFCGKEFTTKFNVRRHQMLYCPQKDQINPKDLGLGKMEESKEREEEMVEDNVV